MRKLIVVDTAQLNREAEIVRAATHESLKEVRRWQRAAGNNRWYRHEEAVSVKTIRRLTHLINHPHPGRNTVMVPELFEELVGLGLDLEAMER